MFFSTVPCIRSISFCWILWNLFNAARHRLPQYIIFLKISCWIHKLLRSGFLFVNVFDEVFSSNSLNFQFFKFSRKWCKYENKKNIFGGLTLNTPKLNRQIETLWRILNYCNFLNWKHSDLRWGGGLNSNIDRPHSLCKFFTSKINVWCKWILII